MGIVKSYQSKDYQLDKLIIRVNDELDKRRMSKSKLSEFINLPRPTIARYFSNTNTRMIPVYIVKAISEGLDIPLSELLIPINNTDLNQDIYVWMQKDIALPYIKKAYQEYLNDVGLKILQKI